jgi:thymidine phosphorylase
MGKKIAAGSKNIVLDVKCGSGAFIKTPEDAKILAENMVRIGNMCDRRCAALITNMDIPLGYSVGNILEVKEAIEVLSGRGPVDLREVAMSLATEMVSLSLGKDSLEARRMCEDAITSGRAKAKLVEWISEQGGDGRYAEDTSLFPVADFSRSIIADSDGYITAMNTEMIGLASVALGAGRVTKDDAIDFTAGIIIEKKTADAVKAGEVIRIRPGESISLQTGMYHSFWAEGGKTLLGEVSKVNDDRVDNRFYEPTGRFPEIEEDEKPLYLLGNEYPAAE